MIDAALLIATDPDPDAAIGRVEPEMLWLLDSMHTGSFARIARGCRQGPTR